MSRLVDKVIEKVQFASIKYVTTGAPASARHSWESWAGVYAFHLGAPGHHQLTSSVHAVVSGALKCSQFHHMHGPDLKSTPVFDVHLSTT